jgi:hypothetical protein
VVDSNTSSSGARTTLKVAWQAFAAHDHDRVVMVTMLTPFDCCGAPPSR